MEITVYNNGYEKTLDSIDSGETLRLITPYGHTLSPRIYYHNDPTVKPFINYCNDDLCIFLAKSEWTKSSVGYQHLDSYSKRLLGNYENHLMKNNYTDNFGFYNINGKGTLIIWELSKEPGYQFSDDKKTLIISTDNKSSQFKLMQQVLQKETQHDLLSRMKAQINKMGLQNKISTVLFTDPTDTNYYQGKKHPLSQGVFGSSYRVNEKTEIPEDSFDGNKYVLILSPFIFFMTPHEQEKLITHELTHILIGVNHMHDSYFWKVYEYYSGASREDDCSWSEKIENNDTYKYDHNYGITTNATLINFFNMKRKNQERRR